MTTSSNRDTKDGSVGFTPKLGGHAKANHANTSSFVAHRETEPGFIDPKEPGQEEGGRMRLPSTSAVGRIVAE